MAVRDREQPRPKRQKKPPSPLKRKKSPPKQRGGLAIGKRTVRSRVMQTLRNQITQRARTILKLIKTAKEKSAARQAVASKPQFARVIDETTLRNREQMERLRSINQALALRSQEQQKTDIAVQEQLDTLQEAIDMPRDAVLSKDIDMNAVRQSVIDQQEVALQQLKDRAQATIVNRSVALVRSALTKSLAERRALLQKQIQEQIRDQFNAQVAYAQQKEIVFYTQFTKTADDIKMTFPGVSQALTDTYSHMAESDREFSNVIKNVNSATNQLVDAISKNVTQFQSLIEQHAAVMNQATQAQTGITTNQAEIGRIDTNTSAIMGTLDSITSDIQTLNTQLQDLVTLRGSLQTQISQVPIGDAASLRSLLSQQQDRINAEIAGLESQMRTLTGTLGSYMTSLGTATSNHTRMIQQKATDLKAAVLALNQDLGSAFSNMGPAASRFAAAQQVTLGLEGQLQTATTGVVTSEQQYLDSRGESYSIAKSAYETYMTFTFTPTETDYLTAKGEYDGAMDTLASLEADTNTDSTTLIGASSVVAGGYPQKTAEHVRVETRLQGEQTMVRVVLPGMLSSSKTRMDLDRIARDVALGLAGPNSVAYIAVTTTYDPSLKAQSGYESAAAYLSNLLTTIGNKVTSMLGTQRARDQLVNNNQEYSGAALKIIYTYQRLKYALERQEAAAAKAAAQNGLTQLQASARAAVPLATGLVTTIQGKQATEDSLDASIQTAQTAIDETDLITPTTNKNLTLATAQQAAADRLNGIVVMTRERIESGTIYSSFVTNVYLVEQRTLVPLQLRLGGLQVSLNEVTSINIPGTIDTFNETRATLQQKQTERGDTISERMRREFVKAMAERERPIVFQMLSVKNIRITARGSAVSVRDSYDSARRDAQTAKGDSMSTKNIANFNASTARDGGRTSGTEGVRIQMVTIPGKQTDIKITNDEIDTATTTILAWQKREDVASLGMVVNVRADAFALYSPYTTSIPLAVGSYNQSIRERDNAITERSKINLSNDFTSLDGAQTTLATKRDERDTAQESKDYYTISIQVLGSHKAVVSRLYTTEGTRDASMKAARDAKAKYEKLKSDSNTSRRDAYLTKFNNQALASNFRATRDVMLDMSMWAQSIEIKTGQRDAINTTIYDTAISTDRTDMSVRSGLKNQVLFIVADVERGRQSNLYTSTQGSITLMGSSLTDSQSQNTGANADMGTATSALQSATSMFAPIQSTYQQAVASLSQSRILLRLTQASQSANMGIRGLLNSIRISKTGRNLSKAAASFRSSFFSGLKTTSQDGRIAAAGNKPAVPSITESQIAARTAFPISNQLGAKMDQKARIETEQLPQVESPLSDANTMKQVTEAARSVSSSITDAVAGRTQSSSDLSETQNSIGVAQGELTTLQGQNVDAVSTQRPVPIWSAQSTFVDAQIAYTRRQSSRDGNQKSLDAAQSRVGAARSSRFFLFIQLDVKTARQRVRATASKASTMFQNVLSVVPGLRSGAKTIRDTNTTEKPAALTPTGTIGTLVNDLGIKQETLTGLSDPLGRTETALSESNTAKQVTEAARSVSSSITDAVAGRTQSSSDLSETQKSIGIAQGDLATLQGQNADAVAAQRPINVGSASNTLAGAQIAYTTRQLSRDSNQKSLDAAQSRVAAARSSRFFLFIRLDIKTARQRVRTTASKASTMFQNVLSVVPGLRSGAKTTRDTNTTEKPAALTPTGLVGTLVNDLGTKQETLTGLSDPLGRTETALSESNTTKQVTEAARSVSSSITDAVAGRAQSSSDLSATRGSIGIAQGDLATLQGQNADAVAAQRPINVGSAQGTLAGAQIAYTTRQISRDSNQKSLDVAQSRVAAARSSRFFLFIQLDVKTARQRVRATASKASTMFQNILSAVPGLRSGAKTTRDTNTTQKPAATPTGLVGTLVSDLGTKQETLTGLSDPLGRTETALSESNTTKQVTEAARSVSSSITDAVAGRTQSSSGLSATRGSIGIAQGDLATLQGQNADAVAGQRPINVGSAQGTLAGAQIAYTTRQLSRDSNQKSLDAAQSRVAAARSSRFFLFIQLDIKTARQRVRATASKASTMFQNILSAVPGLRSVAKTTRDTNTTQKPAALTPTGLVGTLVNDLGTKQETLTGLSDPLGRTETALSESNTTKQVTEAARSVSSSITDAVAGRTQSSSGLSATRGSIGIAQGDLATLQGQNADAVAGERPINVGSAQGTLAGAQIAYTTRQLSRDSNQKSLDAAQSRVAAARSSRFFLFIQLDVKTARQRVRATASKASTMFQNILSAVPGLRSGAKTTRDTNTTQKPAATPTGLVGTLVSDLGTKQETLTGLSDPLGRTETALSESNTAKQVTEAARSVSSSITDAVAGRTQSSSDLSATRGSIGIAQGDLATLQGQNTGATTSMKGVNFSDSQLLFQSLDLTLKGKTREKTQSESNLSTLAKQNSSSIAVKSSLTLVLGIEGARATLKATANSLKASFASLMSSASTKRQTANTTKVTNTFAKPAASPTGTIGGLVTDLSTKGSTLSGITTGLDSANTSLNTSNGAKTAASQQKELYSSLNVAQAEKNTAFVNLGATKETIRTTQSDLTTLQGQNTGATSTQNGLTPSFTAARAAMDSAGQTLGTAQGGLKTAQDALKTAQTGLFIATAQRTALFSRQGITSQRSAEKGFASKLSEAFSSLASSLRGLRDGSKQTKEGTATTKPSASEAQQLALQISAKEGARSQMDGPIATAATALSDATGDKTKATSIVIFMTTSSSSTELVAAYEARQDASTNLGTTNRTIGTTQSDLATSEGQNTDAKSTLGGLKPSEVAAAGQTLATAQGVLKTAQGGLKTAQDALKTAETGISIATGKRTALLDRLGTSSQRSAEKGFASKLSEAFSSLASSLRGLRDGSKQTKEGTSTTKPSASEAQQLVTQIAIKEGSLSQMDGPIATAATALSDATGDKTKATSIVIFMTTSNSSTEVIAAYEARQDASTNLGTTNRAIGTTQSDLATSESQNTNAKSTLDGLKPSEIAAAGQTLATAQGGLKTSQDALKTAQDALKTAQTGVSIATGKRTALLDRLGTSSQRSAEKGFASKLSQAFSSLASSLRGLRDGSKQTKEGAATTKPSVSEAQQLVTQIAIKEDSLSQMDGPIAAATATLSGATTSSNVATEIKVFVSDYGAARSGREGAAANLAATNGTIGTTQSDLATSEGQNTDAKSTLGGLKPSEVAAAGQTLATAQGGLKTTQDALKTAQDALKTAETGISIATGARTAVFSIQGIASQRSAEKSFASKLSEAFSSLASSLRGLRAGSKQTKDGAAVIPTRSDMGTIQTIADSLQAKSDALSITTRDLTNTEKAIADGTTTKDLYAAIKTEFVSETAARNGRDSARASEQTTRETIGATQSDLTGSESSNSIAKTEIVGLAESVDAAGRNLGSTKETFDTATKGLAGARTERDTLTDSRGTKLESRAALAENLRVESERSAQRASATLASSLHSKRETDARKAKEGSHTAKEEAAMTAEQALTGTIQGLQSDISIKTGQLEGINTSQIDQAIQDAQVLASEASRQKQDAAGMEGLASLKVTRDEAAALYADALENEANFLQNIQDVFDAKTNLEKDADSTGVNKAAENLANASKTLQDATTAKEGANTSLDAANGHMALLQDGRQAVHMQLGETSTRDAIKAVAAERAGFWTRMKIAFGGKKDESAGVKRGAGDMAIKPETGVLLSTSQEIQDKTDLKDKLANDEAALSQTIAIHDSINTMAEQGQDYTLLLDSLIGAHAENRKISTNISRSLDSLIVKLGRFLSQINENARSALGSERRRKKKILDDAENSLDTSRMDLKRGLEVRDELGKIRNTLDLFQATLYMRGINRAELRGVSQSYAALRESSRIAKEGAGKTRSDTALDISTTTDSLRIEFSNAQKLLEALRNKESDRAKLEQALKDAGIAFDQSLSDAEKARLEMLLQGELARLRDALENALRAKKLLDDANNRLNDLMNRIEESIRNKEDPSLLNDLLRQLRDAQRTRDDLMITYNSKLNDLAKARARLRELLNEIGGLRRLRNSIKPRVLPPVGAPFGAIAAAIGAIAAPILLGSQQPTQERQPDTSKECAAGTAAGTKAGANAGFTAGRAAGAKDARAEFGRERLRRARVAAEAQGEAAGEEPEEDIYMEYDEDVENVDGADKEDEMKGGADNEEDVDEDVDEEPLEEEEEEELPDTLPTEYEQPCPDEAETRQKYAADLNALVVPAVPGASPDFTRCYNDAYKEAYAKAFFRTYCDGWNSVYTYSELPLDLEDTEEGEPEDVATDEEVEPDVVEGADDQKGGWRPVEFYWPRDVVVEPTL